MEVAELFQWLAAVQGLHLVEVMAAPEPLTRMPPLLVLNQAVEAAVEKLVLPALAATEWLSLRR